MSVCAKCGAPMQEGQDWCLQCGAGADGSLGGGPGWRTGAAILAVTALLVAGASVAAYAALTKTKPKPKTVALLRPVTTSPIPPIPGTSGTGTSTAPGIPTTVAPAPPKIPTQTPTPTTPPPAETTTSPNTSSSANTNSEANKAPESQGAKEKSQSQSGSESEAEPPSPILLDTNAASTYNPSAYPATLFGDPSLAIDGEDQTAWTAQVLPEKAPAMAEGLALDLKSPQKLGSATVKTSTTGAKVEVYGAVGSALPTTIVSPQAGSGWVRLVGLKTLKKKTTSLTLKTKGKSYRFVVLWLVKAPPGSTVAKPGDVAIDELELFPPS